MTSHYKGNRGVLRKRCSENMEQIYRRTPTPKCDFDKVAKQLLKKVREKGSKKKKKWIEIDKHLKVRKLKLILDRSSHRRCSIKKAVLKKFVKFTGKRPVPESLF